MALGDVHERLPAIPRSLSAARAAIDRACRLLSLDERITASIRLAVNEACTNVVVHAYPDQARPGVLELDAGVAGDVMRVVVRDHGIGLAHHEGSPGARLGLPLMSALTQRLEIRRRDGMGTTEVVMEFDLTSPSRDAPA